MGWGCGSSGRAPVWQAQGLEFNPRYHKKKKLAILTKIANPSLPPTMDLSSCFFSVTHLLPCYVIYLFTMFIASFIPIEYKPHGWRGRKGGTFACFVHYCISSF
jgi:hypothetical protein